MSIHDYNHRTLFFVKFTNVYDTYIPIYKEYLTLMVQHFNVKEQSLFYIFLSKKFCFLFCYYIGKLCMYYIALISN
jgi:hypothetical protein